MTFLFITELKMIQINRDGLFTFNMTHLTNTNDVESTTALFDGIHHLYRKMSPVGMMRELIGSRSIHKHYTDTAHHLIPGKKFVLVATTSNVNVMYMSDNYTKKQTDAFQKQLIQNEFRYIDSDIALNAYRTTFLPCRHFRYVGSFYGFADYQMSELVETMPYTNEYSIHPIVCFQVGVIVDGDMVSGVMCHDYRDLIIYPEHVEMITEQALMTIRRFTNQDVVRSVRDYLEIARRPNV